MKPAISHFYWAHLGVARHVLDLGCGSGDLGREKPSGTVVRGLELNAALVVQAKAHEDVQQWDLDDPAPLPFDDESFDAVVAKDVLEHLQKPWRTLREVRRLLKPGGMLLASVVCYRSRRTWADYTHVRGFTSDSARQMFHDAGFEVDAIWRMGGIPLSSRLNLIHIVPYVLRLAPFDWLWTSSYEIKAKRPV